MVHDFGSDFQFGANHHIYRGLGKSKLLYVFLAIPYRPWPEIGALDGFPDPFFEVPGQKCHPPDRVFK